MRLSAAVLACLALLCVLCWSFLERPSEDAPARHGGGTTADFGSILELAMPTEAEERATSSIAVSAALDRGGVAAYGDIDLVSVLTAIGRADAIGDDVSFAALVPQIVGRGQILLATLDLLETGALAAVADARRGALLTLSLGVSRWSRGGGPPDRDGIEWTIETLSRLPRLDEDSRSELATLIAGADIEGAPALDARYLGVVLNLCREHPEQAPAYVRMLERLSEDRAALEPFAATLQSALVETHAPAVQALALRGLYAIDPETGTAAAQSLVSAARGDITLRDAVALTIARAAPAASAVELLLELRDPSQHAAFAALADRPEARSAVRDHYSRLAAAGVDTTGRRILVASMRTEDPALLIGIAESDPSPEVRQQAFLTGTLRPTDGVDGVRSLRTAYERRADPAIGITTRGAVLSANNVVLNSRGSQRAEALRLLTDIARDSTAALDERLLAVRKLRPHVAAESIADLDGLGENGNQAGK